MTIQLNNTHTSDYTIDYIHSQMTIHMIMNNQMTIYTA